MVSVWDQILLMHYLNKIQEVNKLSVTSCKKEMGQTLCSYDTWISSVP